MRLLLVISVAILSNFFDNLCIQALEDCDPGCDNHYRNCEPRGGLPSDKPDEVIDCSQEYFKLRCPLKCGVCKPCDVDMAIEEIKKDIASHGDNLDDLSDKLKEKHDELVDELDEHKESLKEHKEKLDDMKDDLSDRLDDQEERIEANEEDISELWDLINGLNSKECSEDKDCHSGGHFTVFQIQFWFLLFLL